VSDDLVGARAELLVAADTDLDPAVHGCTAMLMLAVAA
jgi:hypothetical protein